MFPLSALFGRARINETSPSGDPGSQTSTGAEEVGER
jgi:hypothetical protein